MQAVYAKTKPSRPIIPAIDQVVTRAAAYTNLISLGITNIFLLPIRPSITIV